MNSNSGVLCGIHILYILQNKKRDTVVESMVYGVITSKNGMFFCCYSEVALFVFLFLFLFLYENGENIVVVFPIVVYFLH